MHQQKCPFCTQHTAALQSAHSAPNTRLLSVSMSQYAAAAIFKQVLYSKQDIKINRVIKRNVCNELYCCTVHFEESLSIAHQQMH
jgi:hypothetical protein